MQTPPPNPPNHSGALEKFRFFARYLIEAIVAAIICNRVDRGAASRVIDRISIFIRRMQWLIARLAAGTYKPRPKTGPRKKPIQRKPEPADKSPRRKRGWLVAALVEGQGYRGGLGRLLRDPDMVALIEAAPAEMVRPLRSLCYMLGMPAPAVLPKLRAPKPRAPRPKRAPMSAAEKAKWAKPRGSISNRLYRNHRPPGGPASRNSA
jgi:hypothetical protein